MERLERNRRLDRIRNERARRYHQGPRRRRR